MSIPRLVIAAIGFLIITVIVASPAYMRVGSGVTNQSPIAGDDNYSLHASGFIGPMTQNDSDPDGDALTLTITSPPSHGGLGTPSGTNTIWYEAAPSYSGTDSFTYQICDPSNACDTATVTITITNQSPIAVDDNYSLHASGFIGPMTQNDHDPDGDALTLVITSAPSHGGLGTPGGTYTVWYEAAPDYAGTDSFTYRICDRFNACATATVTVTVTNSSPIAADDNYSLHASGFIGPMTQNDHDPDGDTLTLTITGGPSHGGLGTPGATYTVWYEAAPGYAGTDSFTYNVCDRFNACATATVNITVANQSPIAEDDKYTVAGGQFIGPMTQNDHDPDGDTLTLTITGGPSHGWLGTPGGTYTAWYEPEPGYVGMDSFTYRICDRFNACDTATVTINDDDGANAGPVSCNLNAGKPVNVSNGNMYLQQTDHQLPGIGASIDITRTYNSNSPYVNLFGRGWSTPYDEEIKPFGGALRLYLSDGRAIHFNHAGSGSYLPVQGDFHGTVLQNADSSFTLTFKDGNIHQFNNAGKLLWLKDLNNNQTTLNYDSSGKLSSVTDPSGRTLNFASDANERVLSISDSLGTIATYTYGSNNELLSVTYADSSGYQFAYASPKMDLTSVTDALGNILESHAYDSNGRALTSEKHGGVETYTFNYVSSTETQVTDALGHVTKYTFDKSKGRNVATKVEGLCSCGGSQVQTWTYDNKLNVTSKTDALNHTTSYTYDTYGNRLTETDATGTITYTHNSLGQVLTRTDQMNGVTTNTYNAQGNLLTTKDALNNTTTLTYDARGQLLTITDARGKVTTFTWDTSGQLTERKDALNHTTTFAYDARARLTGVTDALSRTTTYEYDDAGRMKKVIYPDTNFVLFTYDLAGRRTKIKDPRGNETNFAYDSAYRLTSQTDAANQTSSSGYDLMSNLTSTSNALGRVTNYEYDDFNRLKKVIYPPATTGATRLQETIEYDAAGNASKRTDTAGRDTTFLYDAVDRLTKITDSALKATQFEYNARSQTTAVVDALNQSYTFAYDAIGRTTGSTRAGVSMAYGYDAVGNRTQRTDYNGAVTNYAYDNLNRLTTITYPNSTSATYGYDALSQLTTAANENGIVTFTYDNRNRTASTTDVFDQTVGYSYDANGNRTAMTLNGSAFASYSYDAVNRMSNLSDSSAVVASYAYDAVNKLTSRTLLNGVASTYQYDGLDRLTRLQDVKGTTSILDNEYAYNTASQITQKTDLAGTHPYGYDVVDRLTSASHPDETIEYYTYDSVGNRTASGVSNYTYGAFNRLGTVGNAGGGEVYSHNANGNRTSQGSTLGSRTYTYDFENRLTQVDITVPGGQQQPPTTTTVYYLYDALGRRIQRTHLVQLNFVYDGAEVIQDRNVDEALTSYLNGPGIDNKIRQTDANGSLYYSSDHLGSTQALTDASGNVVEQITYDSFGNGGTGLTRYGYTGREHDPVTGLMYYRARFYDPQVGRFISEDPIQFEGGDINLYVYVHNKPNSFTDPFGQQVRADARWRPGEIEDSRRLADYVRSMGPCPGGRPTVYMCCRGTGVNPAVDLLSQVTGFKHCFIKTTTKEAGMGPAGGGPLPSYPYGIPTTINDHRGQSTKADCVPVCDADETCVDRELELGKPTGKWGFFNNCNSVARGIIKSCKQQPKVAPKLPASTRLTAWDKR